MADLQQLLAWLRPVVAVLAGLILAAAARKGDLSKTRGYQLGGYSLVVAGVLDLTNLSLTTIRLLGEEFVGYGPRYATVQWLARALYAAALGLCVSAYLSGARPAKLEASDRRRLAIELGVVALGATAFGIGLEVLRNLGVLAW